MYEKFYSALKKTNGFLADQSISDILNVEQINQNETDRQNIIKFGMILTQLQKYTKEQINIKNKIKSKLAIIIKQNHSFPIIFKYMRIVNQQYTLQYCSGFLEELQFISDNKIDNNNQEHYCTQDLLYDLLKIQTYQPIGTNDKYLKYLISQNVQSQLKFLLKLIDQPQKMGIVHQHNNKIIGILLAKCNQDIIPIPYILNCLHLVNQQIKLRYDEELVNILINHSKLNDLIEELSYDNEKIAIEAKDNLKFYSSYYMANEIDTIDSAISVLILTRIEVDKQQLKLLYRLTENKGNQQQSTQLMRLHQMFGQLNENAPAFNGLGLKFYKQNLQSIFIKVMEDMIKNKQSFPFILLFFEISKEGGLKLNVTENNIRKSFNYLLKSLQNSIYITSFIQLCNYCKIVNSYQIEQPTMRLQDILNRILILNYQDRHKLQQELKYLFEQQEISSFIISLNQFKDNYEFTIKQLDKLKQYINKQKVIELDSDSEQLCKKIKQY